MNDPTEAEQHRPGVKLDTGKRRVSLIVCGFPRALECVADVGTFGANKYSDNGWASVPNGRQRYTDAMLRHLLAEARGEKLDAESSMRHAACVAWNALARLELELRNEAP